MKKWLLTGLLIVLVSSGIISVLASDVIIIKVNGNPIECDVEPIIINGRTMVPLSTIAEALGCSVEWDEDSKTVSITSPSDQSNSSAAEDSTGLLGLSMNTPVPLNQIFKTPDGLEITVEKVFKGSQAWSIVYEANMYNKEPEPGQQYIVAILKVKNVNPSNNSKRITSFDFSIAGNSNKVIKADITHLPCMAPGGSYPQLDAELFTNGQETGSVGFYVPDSESNLKMIYNKSGVTKVFFSLE